MSDREVFWTEEEEIKDWGAVRGLETKWSDQEEETSEKAGVRWILRAERLKQSIERQYYPIADDNASCGAHGDKEDEEYLETHLEKAFRLNGIEERDKGSREMQLIRDFQRKGSLYLEREPDRDDILEWLAIMRHHGTPTRLLDWTYSFYVAVYFALSQDREGIVWALNVSTINRPEPVVREICERNDFRAFSEALLLCLKQSDFLGIRAEGDKLIDLAIALHLIKHPFPCVYPVNPFRLNRRLSVQRGLFLMPGDITKSFAENLAATFGGYDKMKARLCRVRITPDEENRKKILEKLSDMNISNEALFPGLDGFARSVGEGLAYPRPPDDRQQ